MTSKVLLIKKTKKTKKIRIFKRTYLRHLHKPKFFDHNNIKLLFHNFYGFYLLDGLFKSNKYNFVNLSGNVVKFEYKYKFDTVNLRAVKPRLNELYIYIDVGLKNILQFNSKEFYLNPSSIVETSDRVSVTLFEIEKAFFDSPFQSFP